MTDPARLGDEAGRLAALTRYDVLDTPAEAAFDKIVTLVRSVLGVPMAAVSLIDGHRQWFKARRGILAQQTLRDVSFCAHTIRGRRAFVVPDTAQDPRFADNPLVIGAPYIRAYAGIPLTTPDGYNVGALCALDSAPREFDAAQLAILSSFAALVVDELELRTLAQTDGLTGAFTRRAFIGTLDDARTRLDHSDEPATLAILDLDRFKTINDTHGHPVGDLVLKTVIATCTADLRSTDEIGRLGGEEFGILFTGTTLHDAVIATERLRAAIAAADLLDHPGLRVTASFGLAPLEPGQASSAWLARADAALYGAKAAGRNRCCVG